MQEPPGRSTKIIAGPSPTASRRRSASWSVPQPSLETAVSALSIPVMARTAATIACATAAWDTMMPRSSLIVFLEVLLRIALLFHPLDQPLVERRGRVHTAVAQQMIHGHHFADHREVLAGIERHRHERNPHIEQLGALLVEPGPVVFARGVPVLELHHHLDALLLPHRADPEQRVDVDQTDAANLHEVARDLVPAADEHVVPAPRDVDDVVGDEPVPALDEVEYALALADAGAPAEQQADAEHVGERAVHGGTRRERVVEERLETPVELRRLETGANDGDAPLPGQHQQLLGRFLRLRDDDARQRIRQKRVDRRAPRLRVERREVGDLGFSHYVEPVATEKARRVAGEDQPRAGRFRRADLALESDLTREDFQLQGIALAGEEIPDFEPGRSRGGDAHRGPDTLGCERRARRGRGGFFSSRSWRFKRAITTSSAER